MSTASLGTDFDPLVREILERFDDGFCIIEVYFDGAGKPVDYRFLQANAAFAAHSGLENAVGRTIREMVPDLDESWFRIYGNVAMTGEKVRFENEAAAMQRWFEVYAERVGEPEQRRVAVIFKDITARKQAERALRDSEARAREALERAERERRLLDAVLEAAPVGIIVADASGHLLRVNAANERLWGPAPLSNTVAEYVEWKGWWADRGPRHGQPIAPHEWAMARALRGEPATDDVLEIEPFGAPGVRKTILNSGAPVRDSEGRILGAVVAQMDISARTDAEAALREAQSRASAAEAALLQRTEAERERLRNIFLQAPVAIAIVRGPRHVIELANTRVCEVWQRTPEQVLGRPAFEAFPDQAEAFEAVLNGVRDTGVPFVGTEVPTQFRKADGSLADEVFLNFVYQPLRDATGKIDGVMALAMDVTEGVRARERERALRKDAEEAVRVRDEFLSVASHELKTPLTSLSLNLELLLRAAGVAGSDDKNRRPLEVMKRQLNRLSALVNDLLDVSRITTGRITLVPEPLDLAEVVNEIAARFMPEADRAGSAMTIRGEGAVKGQWDRVRLEQVLSNLFSNAIKYGAANPIHVFVETGEGRARVVVQDFGIGIAEEALPRIFEKFERAVSERHYGGLGLGLYISRQIVEAMGGTIRAESTLGRGTTLTLELPLETA